MEHEPEPLFFQRKSKKPSKKQLAEMKRKTIIIFEKDRVTEPSTEKDIPMPKKEQIEKAKVKRTRKTLLNEQGLKMIKEWDTKSVQEWADEFGVSYQTIANMARVLHKKDGSLCPPKKAKPKTRDAIADEWIALLKRGKGKQ